MPKGTKFTGPIYCGLDDGTATPPMGIAAVAQRIPISADGWYGVKLPACHIINQQVINSVAAATSAVSVRFGVSADDTRYGAAVSVSAVGHYQVHVSGANTIGLAEGTDYMVNVSGLGAQVGTLSETAVVVTYLPTPRE